MVRQTGPGICPRTTFFDGEAENGDVIGFGSLLMDFVSAENGRAYLIADRLLLKGSGQNSAHRGLDTSRTATLEAPTAVNAAFRKWLQRSASAQIQKTRS